MTISRRSLIGAAGAAAVLPWSGLVAAAPDAPIVAHVAFNAGRIWIAAKIEDHGPYYFVVDTGAPVSLLDNSLAKSLRLSTAGTSHLRGVGGVSSLPYYNAGDLQLSNGTRFPNMLFAGVASSKGMGKDAVGTLGSGLFTSYDSDLDLEKGELRIYPDGRPNREGLQELDSRFVSNIGGKRIFAKASIDDFSGEFLLDTGSPHTVSLDSRATRQSGLWDDARPYVPIRSHGIGRGSQAGRLVRAGRLKIGPFVFEKPLVLLSAPGAATSNSAGVIGIGALSKLTLSTEVRREKVWAATNSLPAPRENYYRSGMWVEEDKGRLIVEDVGTASPAALAGVKVGDTIVGTTLGRLLGQLNAPDGTTVPFAVERGGKRQDVTLTLRHFL